MEYRSPYIVMFYTNSFKEKEELEKQKLPGKKLPIWKKRVFGVSEGQRCGAVETTSTTLQPKDKLPVSGE